MRGVEITHTQDTFHMALCSIFAWFRINESYELNGTTPSSCNRRDLRNGGKQLQGHPYSQEIRLACRVVGCCTALMLRVEACM